MGPDTFSASIILDFSAAFLSLFYFLALVLTINFDERIDLNLRSVEA